MILIFDDGWRGGELTHEILKSIPSLNLLQLDLHVHGSRYDPYQFKFSTRHNYDLVRRTTPTVRINIFQKVIITEYMIQGK